ncbi:hypothetical protein SAMN05421736_101525 [Evansella caseinilytica]|uniref:Uncharacterized protein n=1 Tax=Evansella caseinilytica TaxID=1503961 RepID=A0A1H3HK05_9BACI|nr:hypothetical protein SAMN05421736_101525 [Evansella caseinilytica]
MNELKRWKNDDQRCCGAESGKEQQTKSEACCASDTEKSRCC